ncbi:sulfurtransferase FdhD [Novosphingobium marinum]|uniref:Sulfur carrier protein FdhD n=1 Tax=Novosphingobium marinum TaxID=1514948 RepID=A0A7Y9XUL6_9SPHN|nr:formate dehydrogenase accessory sulfurtransferase FdhD [Novosphingobium marinum]NYH94854.1 FdhD protein [Novosphingobium marinum]GGC36850.1 sulfurtransferase FdhD [Novosphingobium marinum]
MAIDAPERVADIAPMAQPVRIFPDGRDEPAFGDWVPEVPVALEFNGLSYAVMMATPADLADFATGFALCEGLAADASDIAEPDIAQVETGWIVRTRLSGLGIEKLTERIRTRVAESSCGLCGIENLEQVARPLPAVTKHPRLSHAAVFRALAALRQYQPLGQSTGAAHAAAWADPDGNLGCVREDVGRHNAMDKLVGAMAIAGDPLSPGLVLSTARCSYEIVEKAVRGGATSLVTISLPTSMAVERASKAGLSLWALARDDSVLFVNDASGSD